MLTGQDRVQTPDLTPRDDVKKMVSEILKRVDNLVRKNELDQAERLLIRAKELDPKNIYAHAFVERIAMLKGQTHENIPAAHMYESKVDVPREKAPTPPIVVIKTPEHPQPLSASNVIEQSLSEVHAKKRSEEEQLLVEMRRTIEAELAQKEHEHILEAAEAARRMEEEAERTKKVQCMIKEAVENARREVEEQKLAIRTKELEEHSRREQTKIKEAAEVARRAEERHQTELRKRAEEELARKLRVETKEANIKNSLTIKQTVVAVPPPTSAKNIIVPSEPDEITQAIGFARQETMSRYRLVLSSVWADGAATMEEDATLKELRTSLSISDEEHQRIEKEVKYETYIEAFKKAWNSGTITPENVTVVAALRDQFQISIEEHLKIEAKLLWEIQPTKNRPSLLIIDDDEKLLKLVTQSLNEAGFITTSVTTSDEAYAYLKDVSPDLILCDVNLETSTMGGFAFYEKIREMESLQQTPFIFLSGLSDEALIRTGKELGVDDYLSKPISEETLVSTIRGKIRRYQELKGRRN